MSLWTPGGEHPVDRSRPSEPAAAPTSGPPPAGGPEGDPFANMTPEERAQAEQMMAEMGEVRRQLSEAPAAAVVANHAMGLYELAAIHLSQNPPNLSEAQVAIDAIAALTSALKGRLGDNEATLHDAVGQLQQAFVQLSQDAPGDEGAQG